MLYGKKTEISTDSGGSSGSVGTTQSYTPTIPKLNKKDHFAYMFGYPDHSFRIDGDITRAEVSAMFARLMLRGIDDNIDYTNTFNDIPRKAWYAKTIGFMQKRGIIKGYVDGSFKPDAPITRAEFAMIASRFDELKQTSNIKFSDLSEEHWASESVNMSATRGWIKGYPDSSFKPENYISRAEAITITNRMLERYADEKFIDNNRDKLNYFNDLNIEHWAYYNTIEATNGHDYVRNNDNSEKWIRLRDLGEVMNTKE